MTDADHRHELLISPELLDLAAECVRLRTSETKRLATLDALLADRIALCTTSEDTDWASIRDHLDAFPTDGAVALAVVLPGSCPSLARLREIVSEMVGSPVTEAAALSVPLFDYLVERRTTKILSKLGPRALPEPDVGIGDNVVRLRSENGR